MKTTRTIGLDTEKDADLLQWLDAQENRSRAVRAALRRAIAREPSATLEGIYQAVLSLGEKIEAGMVQGNRDGDAPGTADAARALDRLGL